MAKLSTEETEFPDGEELEFGPINTDFPPRSSPLKAIKVNLFSVISFKTYIRHIVINIVTTKYNKLK